MPGFEQLPVPAPEEERETIIPTARRVRRDAPKIAPERVRGSVPLREEELPMSKEEELPPISDRPIDEIVRELIPEGANMEFMDHGAENVVFDRKRWDSEQQGLVSKGSVIKIDVFRSAAGEKERDINDPESRKALRSDLENAMAYKERQRHLLQTHFGTSSVPIQRMGIADVPVNTEAYNHLVPAEVRKAEVRTKTMPALVTIQRKIELHPEMSEDITARYAEQPPTKKERAAGKKPISFRDYERGHNLLIGNPFETAQFIPNEEKEHQEKVAACLTFYPRLRFVQARMEQDPQFRSQIRRFAEQLVHYANEEKTDAQQEEEAAWFEAHDMQRNQLSTSRRYPTLDFVGKKNVVFQQRENKTWKPLFLDAFEPTKYSTIENVERTAEKLRDVARAPDSIRSYERKIAANVLHYLRFVNALAILAGTQERVNIPQGIRNVRAEEWRELISPVFKEEETISEPKHATLTQQRAIKIKKVETMRPPAAAE